MVSIIDRQIRAADEVWIFGTPDYYNSWWTLSELACLAYLGHYGDRSMPKVLRCKPTGKGLDVTEASPDFIRGLEQKAAREFGRFLSNSDPGTMGYETIRSMQKMRQRPRFVQKLISKSTQFLAGAITAGTPLQDAMRSAKPDAATMDFERYREMLASYVYSAAFWNDRIVT